MDADLLALRIKVTGGKSGAAEVKALNSEVAASGAAAKSAASSQAAAQARLAKTATSLRSVGRGLSTYVTLPIVGIGVAAGVMSLDFDRSMRNVNSIAQLPEKQFNSLRQQVLDLAGPTAQAPKTLAEGLYDLVSSGFNAAESIIILRKSALAASAGLTTTEVSTKAVAASLNAYHLPAQKAGWVSDTLFETVNRGVLTFDELAQSIGDTLPFAAQLNVPLNQVGAALATMTKQGLSSSEAVTRTKNVLVTLIKPGEDLSKALDKIGMSGEELVKKQGLQGALETIVGTTKGNKDEIAALFPNIRALGGVLSLVGKNAKFANEDLAAFKDTTGATSKVLQEQEKSFGFQLQRGWAKLQVVLIEIGDQLLPVVVPMLLELAGAARDAVDWFSSLPSPLQHTLVGLTGLAALAGPMLLFASAVLKAATNLGILKATETGGIGLNKARLGRMALGGAGVAAIAAGQSGVGGKAGEAVGNIGGGAALGFAVGGTPLGAAIGGGIGAGITLAPLIADLFSADPKISKMRKDTEALTTSLDSYGRAGKAVIGVEQRASRAKRRHSVALRQERTALHRVAVVLARYGPNSRQATHAQLQLAEAQNRVARTAKAEQHMHELSGFRLKAYRMKMRLVVGEIKALLPQQKHRITAMREEVTQGGATLRRLNKLESLEKRVGSEKRKLTAIYGEAESKGTKPFAESLQRLNPLQANAAVKAHELKGRVNELKESLASGPTGPRAFGFINGLRIELRQATAQLEHFMEVANSGVGGSLGKGPQAQRPGHNAMGTNLWRGGPTWLAERGPELVDLPRGSRVIPAPRSRELLATPQAAGITRRNGGGETRYLVATPLKIGKKVVLEAVVEAREDAEARL